MQLKLVEKFNLRYKKNLFNEKKITLNRYFKVKRQCLTNRAILKIFPYHVVLYDNQMWI